MVSEEKNSKLHENQHIGNPPPSHRALWLPTDIMSWWLSGSLTHHLEERSHAHTPNRASDSICTWPRHLWAQWGERPAPPCLVCSSGLSECDKTHEGLRINWGDLQCHDRFTALPLWTYAQWNIYSVCVDVMHSKYSLVCGFILFCVISTIYYLLHAKSRIPSPPQPIVLPTANTNAFKPTEDCSIDSKPSEDTKYVRWNSVKMCITLVGLIGGESRK